MMGREAESEIMRPFKAKRGTGIVVNRLKETDKKGKGKGTKSYLSPTTTEYEKSAIPPEKGWQQIRGGKKDEGRLDKGKRKT